MIVSKIMLCDPRTELVEESADSICHVFCNDCWVPGQPMMCGEPDNNGPECPENCGHPTCSMCELEWERHINDIDHG